MYQKKAQDRNSIKDKEVNRRGEEYNRAVVTVKQNQKEQELMQGSLANMMQMQMIQSQKQEMLDLVAKIDLQQKLLDNKLAATQVSPLPGGDLPMMPGEGLPMMPGGDPMMGGPPMPPPPMGGMPPMDPSAGMDPMMMGAPPPPEMGGMPMNMMPPM